MNNDQSVLLVAACQSGDVRAFDELIRQFEKPVFNVALRMLNDHEEARDVTQTVFMKAFEKLDLYDDSYRFFSWIYRIAVNECINNQAARRQQATLEPDLQSSDSPERNAGRDELHRDIQNALMSLSSEHRSVVILKHLLGFSYQEISDILEVPEKTVKSRLYDGRERLRGMLSREALL
jgi:RNA polymerase sigma-70 factor (ECF subfamily)